LDDVIIPKPFAHWMSAAYVDYDYTQKRRIVCQRIVQRIVQHIVIVIWTNGLIYIPLAFAFWHQKEFVRRYSDIEKKVSQLIKCECHYYGKLNAYVRQFLVKYPGFDMGYLAIVKKDKHDEPGRTKYLFTNDLSLTNTEIVLRYRSRWHIEIFFRTCKQYFGFSTCQAQMRLFIIFAWSSSLTH
jgi:hypothetical protein